MCIASDGTLITVAYDDTLQFTKGAVESGQVFTSFHLNLTIRFLAFAQVGERGESKRL